MKDAREAVKMPSEIVKLYRAWSKESGRTMVSMLGFALRFALEKRSEVERRIAEGWKR